MTRKPLVDWAIVGITSAMVGHGILRAETFEEVARTFEGVYEIESYTINEASCDEEGESMLESFDQRWLVAYTEATPPFLAASDPGIGDLWLVVLSCANLDHCREQARRAEEGKHPDSPISHRHVLHFLEAENRLAGQYVSTGFKMPDEDVCRNAEFAHTTLQHRQGRIRMERRTTIPEAYPAASDGSCSTDGTLAASKGKECDRLTVIVASFKQKP